MCKSDSRSLVAYGVGLDGHRQLMAVTIGAEESEASWSDLLAQLNCGRSRSLMETRPAWLLSIAARARRAQPREGVAAVAIAWKRGNLNWPCVDGD